MELRRLRANEIKLLQDFLHKAIFIPEGVEPPAREIIELPELKIYYDTNAMRGNAPLLRGLLKATEQFVVSKQ